MESITKKDKKGNQVKGERREKNTNKKLSLRTELILWSVGILLVFMGAQLVFTRYMAQNYAMWEKEQQMARLMERLKMVYSDDVMEIYGVVEEAQEIENLRIMIFSDQNLVYHSSSVENAPPRNDLGKDITPSDPTTMDPNRPETPQPDPNQPDPLPFDPNQPDPLPFDPNQPDPLPFDPNQSDPLPFDPNQPDPNLSNERNTLQSRPYGLPQVVQEEVDGNVVTLEETFDYAGELRTIMIWSSVDAIDSAVGLFIRVNLAVSLVVIFVTVLGVIFFSRRFIQPITNVEKIADAVSNMDFSNKANETLRTRELCHLSRSINVMSDRLEEMIVELNADNRHLTNKVENQEKLEQMRRQFVANISHEMKTPLSMLMMYSESLKSDVAGMDKNFYYDTIIQEASGLNVMVEQLLDTSAVENGLSTMDLKPLDFSQFLEDSVSRMTPLLSPYEVSIQISPQIYIQGDVKYLEKAVRNYITNAISHTETGNQIKISLERKDNQAIYTVENQGNPIDEEDFPHLWESFYRADKSRSQREGEKRVGLGLYIVKTCISSHFGSVNAENIGLGVAFSFAIPMMLSQEVEETEEIEEIEEIEN